VKVPKHSVVKISETKISNIIAEIDALRLERMAVGVAADYIADIDARLAHLEGMVSAFRANEAREPPLGSERRAATIMDVAGALHLAQRAGVPKATDAGFFLRGAIAAISQMHSGVARGKNAGARESARADYCEKRERGCSKTTYANDNAARFKVSAKQIAEVWLRGL